MAIFTKEKSFFVGNDNWLLSTIYSIMENGLGLNFVIILECKEKKLCHVKYWMMLW